MSIPGDNSLLLTVVIITLIKGSFKLRLEEHKDKLTLWFLPPYSPELNPQERVWRHTRRKVTHNKYFDKKEDLINAVESKFLEWRSPNVELSNLCVNKKLPKKSNKDNY